MENLENMQQNKVSDEELDQITGGRGLFGVFTAEFRGKAEKTTTLEMNPDREDNNFSVSTLEMRENPLKKKKDNPRVIKL